MARHKKAASNRGSKKPPLTHFLCLPLVNPSSRPLLDRSLKTFTDSVSSKNVQTQRSNPSVDSIKENDHVPHINPKAIRPFSTLHCTLGVMSLDDERLARAIDVLHSLDLPSLLRTGDEESRGPLSVELKGLASMHPPHKTSILYCDPLDKTGRLYPFCRSLQEEFNRNDLLVPDDRPLRLHATILNTIYAREKRRFPGRVHHSGESSAKPAVQIEDVDVQKGEDIDVEQNPAPEAHRQNSKRPLQIDARGILEQHQGFVWADSILLDRIAICEMGAKKLKTATGEDCGEEYTEVASVVLPSA